MSNTRDIDLSLSINAPADAVWRALTESEEVAKWFAAEVRVTPPITPGDGTGKIWVSFGPGMDGEAPIEIFDAPKHFRYRFGDNGETKAPLWVDYMIGNEAGTTTLRLVHSGFSTGADWDEEFDSHVRGWNIFLANLRHYLERHHGERVVQKVFSTRVPLSREAVWKALLSPRGLDPSGSLAADVEHAKAGAMYRMAPPNGAALSGRVDIIVPARDLAFTVDELGDGLLRLSLERASKMEGAPGGFGTVVYGCVVAYGDHTEKAGPLADRLSAVVAEALA